jgi:hypothetical protein
MELDLWVKAREQGGAWEIVKQLVLTPERLQPQPQHLAQLFAEAQGCGTPHSVAFLDAGVETG